MLLLSLETRFDSVEGGDAYPSATLLVCKQFPVLNDTHYVCCRCGDRVEGGAVDCVKFA